MKFINHIFISLFALALSGAVLAFCINQTLLKADYVTAQVDKSGLYNNLATQLPQQISASNMSASSQTLLSQVITADFLRTNIDPYIHQLEAAYAHGTPIPTLDLTSAVTQAQNLGAGLTQAQVRSLNSQLMILPPTNHTNSNHSVATIWYKRIGQSQWLLALVSLILAILVVITAPHHHLKSLGKGFIHTAIWLLGYYVIFRFIPGIAAHQLQRLNSSTLINSINNLIALAASGVAKLLLEAAIGATVIGVGLWLLSHFVPHIGHHSSDDRTPLPTIFHKE